MTYYQTAKTKGYEIALSDLVRDLKAQLITTAEYWQLRSAIKVFDPSV